MTFEEIRALIDSHGDLADFVGPVSEQEVAAAEARLGVRFPPSYRSFLLTYGSGNFDVFEVYGLGVPPIGIPNAVWYTEEHRSRSPGLPSHYVVVYSVGNGEVLCLATGEAGSDGECPVVNWWPGVPPEEQPHETVYPCFLAMLEDFVRRGIQYAADDG